MEILDLIQGSEEWHIVRHKHDTASEAPVMMSATKKMKRDDLLSMKEFDIQKEISGYVQTFLFDKGHEYEAKIRPYIEEVIGEELYPVTGSLEIEGLKLLSSYDGLNMMETIGFEHKMWNPELAAMVEKKKLTPEYYWQLEQQIGVGDLEKIIFVVSDGTPEKCVYMWYKPVRGRFKKLLNGWKQFNKDRAEHQHVVKDDVVEIENIPQLPALVADIQGGIKATNIATYSQLANKFIVSINIDLKSDEDFANAENAGKFCRESIKKLDLVKDQALAKTTDINTMFIEIDNIKEQFRLKALQLEKLVKQEKENRKTQIIQTGRDKLGQLLIESSDRLHGNYITVDDDFSGAIKGKKLFSAMISAINDEVARLALLITDQEELIQVNLDAVNALPEEQSNLFPDLKFVIGKENDDFKLLLESRVDKFLKDAEAAEKKKNDSELNESSKQFVREMEGCDVKTDTGESGGYSAQDGGETQESNVLSDFSSDDDDQSEQNYTKLLALVDHLNKVIQKHGIELFYPEDNPDRLHIVIDGVTVALDQFTVENNVISVFIE